MPQVRAAPRGVHRAMASALRVAFLGDSWLGEWHHGAVVPTPIAVRASDILHERLPCCVDTTIVAFPGCTARNMLRLAKRCSVQDMSHCCLLRMDIDQIISACEQDKCFF